MAIQEVILTNVDIELFENIRLDTIFITIGKDRLKRNRAGLYNQIIAFFKMQKRKDISFLYWLYEKYKLDKEQKIPVEIIEQYEESLIKKTKSIIYAEALRIMYKPDNIIEFYGITNHCVLSYLDQVTSSKFFKNVTMYLQFNPIVDRICHEHNLEHTIDKSEVTIKNDLKMCMKNKLIPRVEKILSISNNKDVYCLAYYDLTLGNKKNPTPAWDSFIGTIPDNGQRQCFKAWVYSVFKDDNFGRQVLWLYGRGNTGKSVVAKAISARLARLNPGICSALPPKYNADKHSSASFHNKRFVISPDTIDRGLIRQQIVKNITGNDDVAVRKMNTEERQLNVYAKIMATSNQKPFINVDKTEELSRILFIWLDSAACKIARDSWDASIHGDWSRQISFEIDDFIAKCADDYRATLDPDGHNILAYPTMEDDLEQGAFSIKRDQRIWWEMCMRPYEPKGDDKVTNIITITQLCTDFERFMGLGRNNKKTFIRSFMCTMMNEKGIAIKNLNANNETYIRDWEFMHPASKRPTMEQHVSKEVEELCYSEDEGENIYGRF